jgi:L-arabinonolactonase
LYRKRPSIIAGEKMLELRPEPSVVLNCRNCLGESIVWDDRERVLYWVNIHDGEVWIRNPGTEFPPRFLRLPERVGTLGLRQDTGFVLALESGFALFDPKTSLLERLADVERDLPTTSLNDGRVNPAGCGLS